MRISLDKFRDDIISERAFLDKELDSLVNQLRSLDLPLDKISRIFFVGCGDSYFSGIFGASLMRIFGYPFAYAENAFEFSRYYPLSEKDFVIAISASGQTKATVEAAKHAMKYGVGVLGITCNPNSPLANVSNYRLIVNTKDHVASPTITTFGITIALYGLAYKLTRKFSSSIFQELQKNITLNEPNEELLKQFLQLFNNSSNHYFIGSGLGIPLALVFMAKLRELNLSHSIFFELEEFMHYGNIPLGRNSVVTFLIDHEGADRLKATLSLMRIINVKTACFGDYGCDLNFGISLTAPSDFFRILHTIHWLVYYYAKKKYGDFIIIRHGNDISKVIRV